ncbi:unnamed protein product [Arabidopsis thaliana]|uniref:(thale cress) hypothetical protein n=1 Tax=Arabidopsis thaliana TaxID=3702 RepID=A0A7G2F4I5_ARATH|nr:unnamed protein product [Arabidopsis thaliana]
MDAKNTKADGAKNFGTSGGSGGSGSTSDIGKTMVAPGSGGRQSV